MQHMWVVDVLRDLRRYAQKNDLTLFKDEIDDLIHVAALELAMMDQKDAPTRPIANAHLGFSERARPS